jgi:hypothetical protein
MLITFFNTRILFTLDVFYKSTAVNQALCGKMLKWLQETVHRERLELRSNDWILHHDNAPDHKVLSVSSFWQKI